jgi:hypothetical protein
MQAEQKHNFTSKGGYTIMTDGKGNCKVHGPYIWKYVDGICITEHLRKQDIETETKTECCSKGASRLNRKKGLTEMFGAKL